MLMLFSFQHTVQRYTGPSPAVIIIHAGINHRLDRHVTEALDEMDRLVDVCKTLTTEVFVWPSMFHRLQSSNWFDFRTFSAEVEHRYGGLGGVVFEEVQFDKDHVHLKRDSVNLLLRRWACRLTRFPGHISFWTKVCPFSNFFPCSFRSQTEDGQEREWYDTETYYQSAKAWMVGDTELFEAIRRSGSPARAKELGQRVPFDAAQKERWQQIRYDVMLRALGFKFVQVPHLKELLLSTGSAILIEGSPSDTVWGVGIHFQDPLISDLSQWRGDNLLGRALMETRDWLRSLE